MYDDGGLSGGTIERSALQRLLSDIKAGKVQIIVVYKVDRLTRSLADFAKGRTREPKPTPSASTEVEETIHLDLNFQRR
jgi:Resolvase, N terminal domain